MMADVQRRSGPQNVGFFGLLQAMDDGLKLIKKELIIPKKSNGNAFLLLPILFFDFSLILFSILPLKDFAVNLDFTLTILFQLFLSNLNLQCNITAGFTTNSKYSLYGSLRIGAQILSQEIIIATSSLIILLVANIKVRCAFCDCKQIFLPIFYPSVSNYIDPGSEVGCHVF